MRIGSMVNSSKNESKELFDCVAYGCWEDARKLVENGATGDYLDEKGRNLLHCLASEPTAEKEAFLAWLLEEPRFKPQVNARDAGGWDPLHAAGLWQSVPAIEALARAGADANVRDASGSTPLRHALMVFDEEDAEKCEPAVRALLRHGADPGCVQDDGYTCAQSTTWIAPLDVLGLLFEMRPQDLAGPTAQALEARRQLSARGALGASLVEKAYLDIQLPMQGAKGADYRSSSARRRASL